MTSGPDFANTTTSGPGRTEKDSPFVIEWAKKHPKVAGALGLTAVAALGGGVVVAGINSGGSSLNISPTPGASASAIPGATEEASPTPTLGAEVLTPETQAIIDRLNGEVNNPDVFFAEPAPDRAVWCHYINRDVPDIAAAWLAGSGNSLDILPEATTTNSPQEIVTILGYVRRGAVVYHSYGNPDPTQAVGFELNEARDAFSCVYLDPDSVNYGVIDDTFTGNSSGWHHDATWYGTNGGYQAEVALDSHAPSTTTGGSTGVLWEQDIQTESSSGEGVAEWREYVRVPYTYNGQDLVTYMIQFPE